MFVLKLMYQSNILVIGEKKKRKRKSNSKANDKEIPMAFALIFSCVSLCEVF